MRTNDGGLVEVDVSLLDEMLSHVGHKDLRIVKTPRGAELRCWDPCHDWVASVLGVREGSILGPANNEHKS